MLWHHPDAVPPRELVTSLTKHGANVLPCRDGYSALAMACRAMRGVRGEPQAVLLLLVDPGKLPRPGAAAFVRAARRYAPRSACWWFAADANPAFRVVTPEDVSKWEGERRAEEEPAKAASPVPADPPTLTLRTTMGREGAGSRRSAVAMSGGAGPTLRLTIDSAGVGRPAPGVEPKPAAPAPPASPPPAPAPEGGASFVAGGFPETPRQALTADELAMLLGEPDLPVHPGKGGNNPETRKKS